MGLGRLQFEQMQHRGKCEEEQQFAEEEEQQFAEEERTHPSGYVYFAIPRKVDI